MDAAVAARVGAVCTAGAPVVVVAGIGFGLDAGTKYLTNSDRGFTEVVSDSILDFVGNAVTCKNPVPFQLHPIFHWGG